MTDRHRCRGRDLVTVVAEAVRGGVRFVLLRERDLPDEPFARLAERLAGILPPDFLLSVHTRAEVARARSAGLHLAEAAPPPEPGSPWHGRSVHGVAAVAAALREGAAYLVGGTVFPSAGKPAAPVAGLSGLRALCAAAGTVPVYAIGGIDAARAAEVRAAGAHGIAVVGAVLEARDPQAAARALCQAVH